MLKRVFQNRFLFAVMFSFIITLISFIFILYELKNTFINNIGFIYPVSDFQILIFLSKPMILFIPFVVSFILLGTYTISKIYMKNVIITTTVSENNENIITKSKVKFYSDQERYLFKLMIDSDAEIFQNDIVRTSGLPKYTVSRILSRFESYGIIRRERYGMTNRIWLIVHQVKIE